MIKGLLKRSDFFFVDTTQNPVTTEIEADEAYITLVTTATASAVVKVQRNRETQLAKVLAASTALTGGSAPVWGNLDVTFGRIPLDAPIDTDGNLKNQPITTAANDLKHGERIRNIANVGIKETLTLQSTSNAAGRVLIELVHYVTADIGA